MLALLSALQEEVARAPAIDLRPLDFVGLGLVSILICLGLARGLWWQVIRLLGLVAAVAVARAFSAQVGDAIDARWPELPTRIGYGLGWFSIFLGVMALATLLGMVGHRLLEAMQLGLANRVGGAVIGGVTGVLLHLALVLAVCQLAPEDVVGRVVTGSYSERLYGALGNVVDPVAAAEVERVLDLPRTTDGLPPLDRRKRAVEPAHADEHPRVR
jgi:uncharacterized membrane protein required for colicin V production